MLFILALVNVTVRVSTAASYPLKDVGRRQSQRCPLFLRRVFVTCVNKASGEVAPCGPNESLQGKKDKSAGLQ
ncbi:Hypothetical protein SMAX5B_014837 [Scophthalmus maximus]|uniref:Secreted protein n=1 Tax=Scophthalmus maximus TaxID=52904 RepID=A0A2U9C307_SCOMX|nr:Hypothetical protein SMAX5B_014837 [Scophthalmus maximus]